MNISVSNAEDIIDDFINIANKYGWGHLEFMVDTGAGANNIFYEVENITILYIHHQVHGYFGLIGIGNIGNKVLPNPMVLSVLQSLSNDQQDVQNLYARVR